MVHTSPNQITVIIVNRNTSAMLMDCLRHVFLSKLQDVPQVIVVDNGSTDDSVDRVRARYQQVQVIEAGRNLGFAAANNLAMEYAAGRFILLVNTDAMLDPLCAPSLLDLMLHDPSVGMAGPQLLNSDGSHQTSYEAVPTLATETLNRSLLKRLFPKRFPGRNLKLTEPEPVEALIGAVMMLRREAVEAVGGFDEGYFFFLEETDLAVRMGKAGWKVVHEPRAKAVHLQGATAGALAAEARIEFYRSRYRFFEKHYGTGSRRVLKAVAVANLTLNTLYLGAAYLGTLGRVETVARRFAVRSALWKWHMKGCPDGMGLPRD